MRKLAISLATYCFSFMAPVVFGAEEGDSGSSWRVEEILVVGSQTSYQNRNASVTRSEIPLIDLPQSVQVLNRVLLNDQDLQSLSQALTNVSGVVPNQEAETLLANPLIRGFESEIFIDSLLGYGDTAVVDPSSLIGVDRIEVAKGPTSTLYGGGIGAPVGGLINLVTKTPYSEASYDLSILAGSFETSSLGIDINQPLSDEAGFRIAVERFDSDDYIEGADVNRLSVNPSFSWELSTDTELVIRGLFSEIEQLEYTGLPIEVAALPGVDPYQFTGALNGPRTDVSNQSVHGELTHRFSPSLSTTLQLRRYESEFDEHSSYAYTAFFPVTGSSAAILKGRLPAAVDETTLDASFNWSVQTSGIDHSVLGGVFLDSTDYEAGIAFDFNPIGFLDYASGVNNLVYGSVPAIDPTTNSVNAYETKALYLQDQLSFTDRFSVLLSGRYTHYKHEEGFPGFTTIDTDYKEFDYRAGLSYRLSDSISLFGGYATGSRMSLFFSGVNGAPPEPEESRSAEIGLKFSEPSTQLSGSLVAFQLKRDKIPTLISFSPFAQVQTGEQETQGIELDLIWEPNRDWSLLFNLASIEAEYTEAVTTSTAIITPGTLLARVPEESGRLAAHYRVPNESLSGLSVGAGVSFASEAPLSNSNLFYSDSYAVVDLHVDYEWANFEIGLNINNLLDREYLKPYQFLSGEIVRPGSPFAAFVTLKANL